MVKGRVDGATCVYEAPIHVFGKEGGLDDVGTEVVIITGEGEEGEEEDFRHVGWWIWARRWS